MTPKRQDGLHSMTGFGAASAETPDGQFVARVEIRSVNHRYLQTKLRFPPEFVSLEPGIEEAVRKRVSRGVLNVTASVSRSAGAGGPTLNVDVARRYQELLVDLAQELQLDEPIALDTLLALPGVVGADLAPDELEREGELLQRAAREALDALVAMRATEGRALAADVRLHAAEIRRLIARIAERIPTVVSNHQKNLLQRVQELVGDVQAIQPADMAREIAILAERLDVHEELARLGSHLDQLDELIAGGGSIGRRLDFLVQELLREANTIGSKCNDAPVAHAVVELKTHIDRVKEQVQNVE